MNRYLLLIDADRSMHSVPNTPVGVVTIKALAEAWVDIASDHRTYFTVGESDDAKIQDEVAAHLKAQQDRRRCGL